MHKLVLLLALTATLGVTACNTVAGAGRDVEAAGEAVTNTAQDAKN
jgi:predicted small secreted protein